MVSFRHVYLHGFNWILQYKKIHQFRKYGVTGFMCKCMNDNETALLLFIKRIASLRLPLPDDSKGGQFVRSASYSVVRSTIKMLSPKKL